MDNTVDPTVLGADDPEGDTSEEPPVAVEEIVALNPVDTSATGEVPVVVLVVVVVRFPEVDAVDSPGVVELSVGPISDEPPVAVDDSVAPDVVETSGMTEVPVTIVAAVEFPEGKTVDSPLAVWLLLGVEVPLGVEEPLGFEEPLRFEAPLTVEAPLVVEAPLGVDSIELPAAVDEVSGVTIPEPPVAFPPEVTL